MPHGRPPPTGSPPHDATYEPVEIIIEARTAEQTKPTPIGIRRFWNSWHFTLPYFWLQNTYNIGKNKNVRSRISNSFLYTIFSSK